MKKLLGIVVLGLMFCTVAHTKDGYGDINLNERTFQHFIDYIMGDKRVEKYSTGMDKEKPVIFAVTPSGKYSASYYCPSNYFKKYGGCGPTSSNIGPIQLDCKKYAKKRYYVTLCEEIPGMIYEMSTVVPSASGSEPLIKEILTFEKVLN